MRGLITRTVIEPTANGDALENALIGEMTALVTRPCVVSVAVGADFGDFVRFGCGDRI